ncbi:MAG: hypothetical protein IPI77_17855 [Saprospiraceae bacterium]|nr:hypothetical protein [Saprospiraceae bacterium]
MRPIGYQSGQKYPAILDIHGGPTAMWGPGEASMWHEFPILLWQRLYGGLLQSKRIGGYGEEFMRANINDWGKGLRMMYSKLWMVQWPKGIDTGRLAVTSSSYA